MALLEEMRVHGLHDGSLKEKLIARGADEIERLQAKAKILDNALAIAVDCSALCVGCRAKVNDALKLLRTR